MPTLEREGGNPCMIEGGLVERPELAVDARVLNVTRHAVSLHIAVHARTTRDSIGDGFVARKTLLRRDAPASLVTFDAIRNALQCRVRLGECTRRQQRAQLSLGRDMRYEAGSGCKQRHPQSSSYHLNGTYPRYIVTPTCAATMMSWRYTRGR